MSVRVLHISKFYLPLKTYNVYRLLNRCEGLYESPNLLFGTPVLPASSAKKRRFVPV